MSSKKYKVKVPPGLWLEIEGKGKNEVDYYTRDVGTATKFPSKKAAEDAADRFEIQAYAIE